MKLLLKLLVTAILVLLIAHFMRGVIVANFTTSLIVAFVLSLLNLFIKPILVVLTLPVTVVTLGLFLLVINALIVVMCTYIVGGFKIDGFATALWFSIVLSVSQSVMYAIIGKEK